MQTPRPVTFPVLPTQSSLHAGLRALLNVIDIYQALCQTWPYSWTWAEHQAWQATQRDVGYLVQRLSTQPQDPLQGLGYVHALRQIFKERVKVLFRALSHLESQFTDPVACQHVKAIIPPLTSLMCHEEQGFAQGPILQDIQALKCAVNVWHTYQKQRQEALNQQYSMPVLRAHALLPPGLDLSPAQWALAKRLQHEIVALQATLKAYPYQGKITVVVPQPSSTWLMAEQYLPCWMMHQAYGSRSVLRSLKHYRNQLKAQVQAYHALVQRFYQTWGEEAERSLRAFRVITLHEHWQQTLSQQAKALTPNTRLTWSHACQWHALLTLGKKQFFTAYLRSEKGYEALSHFMHGPFALENDLTTAHDKQTVMKALARARQATTRLQTQVYTRLTSWQKMLAFLEQALSQQPDFILGSEGTVLTERLLSLPQQSYLGGAIGGDPLPESLLRKTQYLTGLTTFFIGLWTSHWVGYSYHGIAAVNRVLYHHYDGWLAAGLWLDSRLSPLITRLAPCLDSKWVPYLHTLGRWDEIALVEKDAWLRPLTQMGLHTLFYGRKHPWAAGLAYLLATLTAEGSQRGIHAVGTWQGWSTTTSQRVAFVGHVMSFLLVYPLCYARLAPSPEDLALRRARDLFGFHAADPIQKTTLSTRYHQLALTHHPDKCQQHCATEQSEAETFSACMTRCDPQAHDQMAEINEAYALLRRPL